MYANAKSIEIHIPSWLDMLLKLMNQSTNLSHIYIYIYIYICVCVCVCVNFENQHSKIYLILITICIMRTRLMYKTLR